MTGPARRDLSALTGGRAAGLRGTLPLAPPGPPAAAPQAGEDVPAAAAPAKPATPRRKREKAPTTSESTGRRLSYGVGLPVRVVERMAAAAEKAGQTYGDWLMAALDHQYDHLELVYPPLPARRPELPPARRSPRRQVPGGRQPVNFRLLEEEIAALDARQAQLAVESRSEFATTIVELELKKKEDS